jgi:predicted alpha/beta superfamily hydrolase
MKLLHRIGLCAMGCALSVSHAPADTGPVWGGVAPMVDVEFEVDRTTVFGQSVFVLGDIAELGGGSSANAIKLSPGDYPTWRVTVALPAGESVAYRFIVRPDAPGQQNGSVAWTGPMQTVSVPGEPGPAGGKVVFASTTIADPVLHWRDARLGGDFAPVPMSHYGPAAPGRPNEQRWFAWGMHEAGGAIEFYIASPDGSLREPAASTHRTGLDGVFVQGGQVFSYVPAASVSPALRAYSPANVPTLFSPQLNQNRGYRVFLPRGYAQHSGRRYPVLYMHDGQNVFEQGAFGSWNAAPTLARLQAEGVMREVIVVALDNAGQSRIVNYVPPSDNFGRCDDYAAYIADTVKPFIDANYRTLPDRAHTAVAGSSLGGVASVYMGYERPDVFGRIGAFSTAWWYVPNFTAAIRAAPAVNGLRFYMDTGDSGQNNDDYWNTIGVRDALTGGSPAKYAIGSGVGFAIGFGDAHNEAAWADRLPNALEYLFPSGEEPNEILAELFSPSWDINNDGSVDVEDRYLWSASPTDLTGDGAIDRSDARAIDSFLRRGELLDPRL